VGRLGPEASLIIPGDGGTTEGKASDSNLIPETDIDCKILQQYEQTTGAPLGTRQILVVSAQNLLGTIENQIVDNNLVCEDVQSMSKSIGIPRATATPISFLAVDHPNTKRTRDRGHIRVVLVLGHDHWLVNPVDGIGC
jgi:hypothetical protein